MFDVEGVIVGDERTWRSASFRWLDEPPAASGPVTDDASTYVLLLRPMIDRLTRTVEDAQACDADA